MNGQLAGGHHLLAGRHAARHHHIVALPLT
jgi:hypothetical protein